MRTIGFVLLLALALPFQLATAAGASSAYDARMAEAAKLAAEGSWARAREAYVKALAAVPNNPDAKRWTQFRLADATWRAEPVPDDYDVRNAWLLRHHDVLSTLIETDKKPSEVRDEFWMAVLNSRADLGADSHIGTPWPDRLAIAGYLANQPPSTEAATRYVKSLQDSFARTSGFQPPPELIGMLEDGARIGATADERAWCAVQAAYLTDARAPDLAATRWTRALAAAQNTRWLPHARAGEFNWRANHVRNDSPDFSPRISELASVRRGLGETAADSLADDLRQSLVWLEARWTEPRLQIQISDAVAPGQPVQFSYGSAGYGSVRFRILRFTPAEWVSRKVSSAQSRRQPVAQAGTPVRDWSVTFSNPAEFGWNADIVESPALEPGFYTLAATSTAPNREPDNTEIDFLVTSASATGHMAVDGSSSVFIVKLADGAPLARTQVAGLIGAPGVVFNPPATWRDWSGTTDDAGRVIIPAAGDAQQYQGSVVAMANGQPVWLHYYSNSESRLVIDTFLDRPLFRPGETVRWKIIARERRDGGLVVPDRDLRITVQLHNEKLIDAQPLRFNAFGTASGEIALQRNAQPGTANLLLTEGSAMRYVRARNFFLVDNYVPPAISASASLASGPDSLRPGREVVIRVQASYLSGGPAAAAAVEGIFSSSEGYRMPWDNDESQQSYESWRRSLATSKAAVTDALGVADLRLQLPDYLPASSELGLNVRVIPEGGQPVETNQSFTVTSSGAIVDAGQWTEPRLGRPGESFNFKARILDGAGDLRPFQGIARLVERRWIEAWISSDGRIVSGSDLANLRRDFGLAPGETLPAPWRKLETITTSSTVAESPVETGANGELNAAFTLPSAGFFQLQLFQSNRQLAYRQSGSEVLSVFAADEQTAAFALSPDSTRILGPEKITKGESMRVLVILPEGQRQAYLSVQGDDAEVTRRIELPGRAGLVVVDDVPPALNAAHVSIHGILNSSYSATVSIPVDHAAQRLAIQVAPATEFQRPGAASTVRLTVRDASNRPVRAEIAIGGSDESVNQLGGFTTPSDPAFWDRSGSPRWRFARMPSMVRKLTKPIDPRYVVQEPYDVEILHMNAFTVTESVNSNFMTSSGSRLRLTNSDVPTSYRVINREFIHALGITEITETASWGLGQSFGLQGVASVQTKRARMPGFEDVEIEVRQHFASTILWAPSVVTDERGEAVVPVTYADNLTQWRFEAYGVGADPNLFGRATVFTRTSLPLQSRLQLPRFLVAGDSADTSGLFVNRTDQEISASVALTVEGAASASKPVSSTTTVLKVPAQGEATAMLPVRATATGTAKFSAAARAGVETDAMLLDLPVLEDGLQQLTAITGKLATGGKKQALTLELPTRLERERTQVSVHLSPSYAAAILDALPYLVDYPYGCVEQTMSRFLPAVVVRKTLLDLGFEAAAVERRILGKESPADAARRAQTAGLSRLDEVIKDSLARLGGAGADSGGFGWWPGASESNPWMTAYVLWGTTLAKEAGVKLPENFESILEDDLGEMLDDGMEADAPSSYRARPRTKFDDGSLALVVATVSRKTPDRDRADEDLVKAFDQLYTRREQLPAAGKACLLLASRTLGTPDQRAVLLRNLDNGTQRVRAAGIGDTVHWGSTTNYWNAMDGAVEATSLNLLALLELNPSHPLVEPAANWLLLNRRSNHWDSTRSTAFAVLALAKFIEVRKEANPDASVELRINGQAAGRRTFTRDSLLEDAPPISIDPKFLRPGSNRIELIRTGGSTPVYAAALASSWAAGDVVKPASNQISVGRSLDRMKPQASLIGTVRLVPLSLPTGGSVVDGEQVTAIVKLTVPNDLEYVMVEVPKPAGCEPLNALSGWDARLMRVETEKSSTAQTPKTSRPIYREEHDEKTVFFLDRIAAGTWEIRFTMRAMTAGDYRVLPAVATAMYVPEVRANSDARRLKVEPAQ